MMMKLGREGGNFYSSLPFGTLVIQILHSTRTSIKKDYKRAGGDAGVCYLGWFKAFLCELADLLFDFSSSALQPRRRRAFVRDAPLGDPLSGAVHATHGDSMGEGRGELYNK